VLIEHDMRVVFHLADRICVLDQGRLAGRRHAAGDRRQRGRAGRLSGKRRMNALEAEGLHTYYGKSHILHGVSARGRRGRDHHAARPQRRRQDHHAAQPDGPHATPARGKGHDLRPGDDPLAALSHRRTWGRLRAGGTPHIFRISRSRIICGANRARRPWTPARIYELFPRLAERKRNQGRQLSGGEQEMLSISRALLLNPRLLMLDEPSQGLAPLIVKEVFRIVEQMRAEGMSILLVEQNVRMSLEIADYAYVLDNGVIVYHGPARELASDETRVRSLAGASAEEWTFASTAFRRLIASRRPIPYCPITPFPYRLFTRSIPVTALSSWVADDAIVGWTPKQP
jgi:branched-chain amino acid transport system ATP-binding protein